MAVIKTTYEGDMLFKTVAGNHTITIDVPPGMGGEDRGPTPPQLFITSLGSCVAVLVTDFCDNHGLDPTGLEVDVAYDKATHPARLTDIQVTVRLPNAECDDDCTRKAIKQVAEHCPVHETIKTMRAVVFNIETN